MNDNQLYTDEKIFSLPENHIFVFGSNTGGFHGKGAALFAKNHFGARFGIGEGLQGQSYALPTKIAIYDLNHRLLKLEIRPISDIFSSVNKLISLIEERQDLTFHVTEIGCGLAKYSPKNIAPMFSKVVGHPRVYLPMSFILALRGGH